MVIHSLVAYIIGSGLWPATATICDACRDSIPAIFLCSSNFQRRALIEYLIYLHEAEYVCALCVCGFNACLFLRVEKSISEAGR